MNKPKLLHIALGKHNDGLWRSFEKEFETTHFDWTDHRHDIDKLNNRIMALHKKIKPDVVFMQIQTAGIIHLKTAKKMTETSFTVNWTGDVRYPLPEWYVQMGKVISVSLFSNMFDVKEMTAKGVNADFLQVGFDPAVFNPFGKTVNGPKIIFMGSNYGQTAAFPLSDLRLKMVQRLSQTFGKDFMVYGSGWEKIVPEATMLDVNNEAITYRSCDIAVSLSHFDYGRYSSDRIFRLMGSGAFCLSHHYKHIEKDFGVNQHLDTWSNIDELIEKIKYYQKHVYEREVIRITGCKYVRENCNWDVRIKEFKQMAGLYIEKNRSVAEALYD